MCSLIFRVGWPNEGVITARDNLIREKQLFRDELIDATCNRVLCDEFAIGTQSEEPAVSDSTEDWGVKQRHLWTRVSLKTPTSVKLRLAEWGVDEPSI